MYVTEISDRLESVHTTRQFMTFPDVGHIQEVYSNHHMYCSYDMLSTHDMSCTQTKFSRLISGS